MCQRADNRELEAQNMRNSKSETISFELQPPASSLQPPVSSLQPAFTLVEVLIVVGILALLAAGLVGLSSYLQTHKDTVLTEKCVQLLSTAVAEYHEITGHFPVHDWNDRDADGSRIAGATYSGSDAPSSDELLYLQLSLLPQTREIIANLPGKLLAKPLSEATVQLRLDATTWVDTPYLRSIVDPWHTEDDPQPLNYLRDPDDPDDVFPKIWSYGPDGLSDDDLYPGSELDDISNED